ncbi:MAG TPA: hypothetical protein VN823_01595 [Stellaceae bacterium]|nr:hypothetical protein [Stellaceae bacterium]
MPRPGFAFATLVVGVALGVAASPPSLADSLVAPLQAQASGGQPGSGNEIEYVVGAGAMVGFQSIDIRLTAPHDPVANVSKQHPTVFEPFGEVGLGIPLDWLGISGTGMDLYVGARFGGTLNSSTTSTDQLRDFEFTTSQGFFINPNVQLQVPVVTPLGPMDVFGEAGALLRRASIRVDSMGSGSVFDARGWILSPELGIGAKVPFYYGLDLVPEVIVDLGTSITGGGNLGSTPLSGKVTTGPDVHLSLGLQKRF